MAKVKFDSQIIGYISLFESLTRAHVKDCIVNDQIIFVVHENEMGKAIGKGGQNVKRIQNALKKNIIVVEFNDNLQKLILNIIHPLKVEDIEEKEKLIIIHAADRQTRGKIIGHNKFMIQLVNTIVKRYFDVDEVKVV